MLLGTTALGSVELGGMVAEQLLEISVFSNETVVEFVDLIFPKLVAVYDVVTLEEDYVVSPLLLPNINVSDTETIVEVVSMVFAFDINVFDLEVVSDSINTLSGEVIGVYDNSFASESVSIGPLSIPDINVYDADTIVEDIAMVYAHDIDIYDVDTITEDISTAPESNISVEDTDSIVEVVTIEPIALGDISVVDTIVISEGVNEMMLPLVFDDVTITESLVTELDTDIVVHDDSFAIESVTIGDIALAVSVVDIITILENEAPDNFFEVYEAEIIPIAENISIFTTSNRRGGAVAILF